MLRLRSSLLLLAILALLTAGTPLLAGPDAAPVLPTPEAGQCPAQGTAAPGIDLAVPPIDFILCTCKLCEEKPDEICQISPSGYSILCSDWYRSHC